MDQMSPVRPGDADDEDEPLLLGHGIQAEELLSVDEIDLKVEKDDFEENSSPSSTSDWIGLTKSRIPYYIPILHWLPRYQWRENFVNDILAGFSVGMVLVPQCLAYSLVMGVSPAVGFYSGWMPLVVYFFMGTSKDLIVGPEGVFSLLIGSTVKTFAEQQYLDTTQEAMGEYVAGLAVIVGFFSLLLGLARVGFLDNLVSHPIVCGYINACSLLLFIGQLGSFFGIQIYGNFAYDKLYSFFTQIKDTKPLTPLFGITSLAVLVLIELVKRKASKYVSWARRIPTTFIVLVVGVTLSATLNLHSLDVDTLGQFENGFPTPFFPPLFSTQMVPQLLIPGFLVTLVGFVEGMAVYKQFCIDHSYHLSPNRELVAFGLMNMIGGLFRAFPASASMPRSKISNLSGASSQFVGLVASILPLVMVTSAMPVLFFIPKVTISTIIMVAALRLGSWRELVYLIKLQAWNEVVVFWVTLLLTFFLGPEIGIIVAFGMSLFLLVKTSSSLDVAHLGVIQADTVELTRYRDVRKFPLAHRVPGFAILRIDSPLVFINISTFIDRIGRCERLGSPYSHPYAKSVLEKPIHTIILDALNISHIDAQSSLVITETASHYKSRDVRFLITNLRPQLRYKLMVSSTVWVDSLDAIGPDSFFSSLSAAIASVEPNSEFLVHDNHELSSYTALHG